MTKDDIESSIHILSGLLGYSERMGLPSDWNANYYCKEENNIPVCPARELRKMYEEGLKTAIEVLRSALQDGD